MNPSFLKLQRFITMSILKQSCQFFLGPRMVHCSAFFYPAQVKALGKEAQVWVWPSCSFCSLNLGFFSPGAHSGRKTKSIHTKALREGKRIEGVGGGVGGPGQADQDGEQR